MGGARHTGGDPPGRIDRATRIAGALTSALPGSTIDLVDESALHAGHAGAHAAGETHYRIAIVSPAFVGMTRIARSRLVHETLAPEFASGLHALSLLLRAPGEAG